ncbi:MAG: response regulator [Symbiobacteriia bacterium]
MKRVLVVDDAAFMRMMIKDILSKTEYEVVAEAANGQEGLDRLEEARPDVIILDITMPVMDGLTAAEEIVRRAPRARIVFCSAMGQKDVVMKALGMGAADFVVKPFTADRLLGAIRKAVGAAAEPSKGA